MGRKCKLRLKQAAILLLIILLCISVTAFANSGRTDVNGGHTDNYGTISYT